MADGIIDMHDMETIFSVTDGLGIHRESVSVELTKEDPGLVQLGSIRSPDSSRSNHSRHWNSGGVRPKAPD